MHRDISHFIFICLHPEYSKQLRQEYEAYSLPERGSNETGASSSSVSEEPAASILRTKV
jgi:hypothetical protein